MALGREPYVRIYWGSPGEPFWLSVYPKSHFGSPDIRISYIQAYTLSGKALMTSSAPPNGSPDRAKMGPTGQKET